MESAALAPRLAHGTACRIWRIILELLASPAAWAALVTLIVMEVVLGIDNLIFISILSNKLPEEQRRKARESASAWRW
jgi:predicted tellurium resistance membrane protein TerC